MEKELHNHPFSLSPSTCQPFVLSFSKETAGILRTGLSMGDPRMVRPAHHERKKIFTPCITCAQFDHAFVGVGSRIPPMQGSVRSAP